MKPKDEALIRATHDFFRIHLPKQKCYSKNTVASYKYAFNLFLDYMNQEHTLSFYELSIHDFNYCNISGYLNWLSAERKNSAATCNQRLMALRSFGKYLGLRDFSLAAVQSEIASVPSKKNNSKIVEFLSESALKTLLSQPNISKPKDLRNQFFMILMYDTAARCQELLDSKISDFSIDGATPFMYLTGKGGKTRSVPLMHTTVRHLLNYLSIFHPEHPRQGDAHLFYVITHGIKHPLSTDTVETFVKKYGNLANQICADMPKRVHPHQLRHTRAIHLYRAGMPLALLAEFLGHVSIETTRVYAYADTEMKRKAIEKATPAIAVYDETPIWDESDEESLRRLAGLR